jgi:hypothetical protein
MRVQDRLSADEEVSVATVGPPLIRSPLGGAWCPLVVVGMLAAGGLSCASVPAQTPKSQECPGPPVELGKLQSSWLSFRVVGPDGTSIDGFAWRYRQDLIVPGRWSNWEIAEAEGCKRYDSCGYAGITDMGDGTWEIEVCSAGHRPLHAYLDVRESNPGLAVVLTAQNAE